MENKSEPLPMKISQHKVSVGWQHFDDKKNRYVSVRMGRGGGTRDIVFPLCATKEEIMKEMLDIFFPSGKCVFGDSSIMKFALGNFKCDEIKDGDFTVGKYIAQHKLSKVRLYLLSMSEEMNESVSLSDSEDELPPAFGILDDEPQSSNTLLGSSVQRSGLREEQDAEFRESLFQDQQMEIKKQQEIERIKEKIDKEESLHKSRCEKVLIEPNVDDPHANVSVRHITLGICARRFPKSCTVSSLYDWVGSLSRYPAYFSLSSCGISNLDPTLPIMSVDRALVSMVACDEEMMFPPAVNFDEERPPYDCPEGIIITENIPDVLLVDDEPLVSC